MAKSQRRSNREAKKPKKSAAEKLAKNPALAITNQIAGAPTAGTSYKDRYK